LAFTFYLLFAEETLVNQPVKISSPQHASNPNSPRVQTSTPPPSRNFSFTKDAITPFSSRSSRDESIFTSARASNLPGTAPASPQLEASALPGTPQAPPQLITHEIPLEPEQTPSPIQEARNEVSISIQLCYFPSINHP
jgi:hypothetical protein